jgi:hypothetical protein
MMKGESLRTRGWGGMCREDAVLLARSSNYIIKIKRETDGGMVLGGRH